MGAGVATLCTMGELGAVRVFVRTEWRVEYLLMSATAHLLTGILAALVLLVTALLAHWRHTESAWQFLWNAVEVAPKTPWRVGVTAFMQFMIVASIITSGMGALGW
jgi:cell division protein FtsX